MKVSGVVANAEGDVMENIKVKLVEKTTTETEVKEPNGFWGKIKKALTGDTSYFKQVNTNEDGEYSFDDVPFNKTYTLIIEGLGGYTDYSEDIVVHETNIDNDVELTVSHGDVKFKVLSELGAVLPDVLVWLDDEVYEETDEDGECTFTLDAGEYTASIELADYETVEKTFTVNVPTKTINVTLSSMYIKISGICKNTDGERVPEATLRLYYDDTICNQTETDHAGVYELTGVEKHLNYVLHISVDNYEPYSKHVNVEDHDMRVDINDLVPIETHYVVFLVTKSEDHTDPVPGALITLDDGQTTTTNGTGRGGFQNLLQGLYDATISYTGRKNLTKTFRILDEDLMDVPAYLEFTIVTGTVTMADGYNYPVADATVELQQGGTNIDTTTTDEDGNFAFIGQTVVGETYHIVVSKEYYETVYTDIFEATGSEIKLVSLPTAKYDLSGTVKEGTTPLAGVNMVLQVAHTTTYYEATTDENGHYSFTDKMHGGVEYTIAASKSDYQTTEETFTCTGDTTKNLQLNKSVYTVSGTVKDDTGANIGSATVKLYLSGASESLVATVTSGSNGSYSLNGMYKGKQYYVSASKTGYTTGRTSTYECTGSNITGKTVTIPRIVYTVSGTITNDAGKNVSGATVELKNISGTTLTSTTSSSGGAYTLSGMYYGTTYKIYASASYHLDKYINAFTCSGNITGKTVNLTRITYTVSGTISENDYYVASVADATVELKTREGEFVDSTTSGSNGAYTLSGMHYDRAYYLIVSKLYFDNAYTTNFPCTGDITLKNITIGRTQYKVSGRILDPSGNTISGATVTLEMTSGTVRGSTTSGSGGYYEVSGMFYPVTFRIKVTKSGYQRTYSSNFTCSGSNITGKDITITPTTSKQDVSGYVHGYDTAKLLEKGCDECEKYDTEESKKSS